MVKISGDLAVKSVIERNLFQRIVMYGLLMDFENRQVVVV